MDNRLWGLHHHKIRGGDMRQRKGGKGPRGSRLPMRLMGPLIAITRPQVYDMSIAKGARAFGAHVLAKCSVIRDFGALITRVVPTLHTYGRQ